jgi:manganese/zinc/iron transport system permease protein
MDPIIVNISLSLTFLAIACAITGVFAYVKNDSLAADAIAHASLPGVCIGFMIAGYKSNIWMYSCALLTGIACQYLIHLIVRQTKIKKDTATALVLTTLFSLGLVLSKYILDQANYQNKSGISHFLFGQAASIQRIDFYFIASISCLLFVGFSVFGRAIKAQAFDPIQFKVMGWPEGLVQWIFNLLICCTVIIGIQAVGVVLMSALIITPAVIARSFSNHFRSIVILAIVINCLCVWLSTYVSIRLNNPTGPWVIVTISLLAILLIPIRNFISSRNS